MFYIHTCDLLSGHLQSGSTLDSPLKLRYITLFTKRDNSWKINVVVFHKQNNHSDKKIGQHSHDIHVS